MVNFYSCYVANCTERTVTVEDVAGKIIYFSNKKSRKYYRFFDVLNTKNYQ